MNISFSVLSPPTIWHASQMPSRALGPVSQPRSVLQLAGGFIFPATHCSGVQCEKDGALGGTCEARVTSVGSGDPSDVTPLLYGAQKCSLSPALNTRGGSNFLSGGSL